MALASGVRRLAGGAVRVRLTTRERDVLRTLPAQLRPLLQLGGGDPDRAPNALQRRLFPHAYADDPLAELEYRALVGDAISEDRLAAVDDFARTLDGGSVWLLTWSVVLTAAQADAWLSALNDARLTLATIVGVTDESVWEGGPDRTDSASVLLWYLGWLQEQLLAALMGSLDEGS